ncbi:MAG: DUF1028 domain-containing protein [Planctomycetes bacterium]|nr:DUF1028 domain-containing protein [Planctomycetota bacterium]
MGKYVVGILASCLVNCASHAETVETKEQARTKVQRPVSTYSIVARDPKTGELGVAVQSHWFSVGSVVPWAKAGVGAVATQSLVDPTYGPVGLTLMEMGRSGPDALASVLAGDAGREVRQVAMIDAKGRVAGHTGKRCIAEAGHVVDEKMQFSVQANLMARDTVWPAMAAAFRSAEGDLADRMLAALEAAQGEGGDIRGRQSAALIVVSAQSTGKPWLDRKFDLRIEDHPEPVKELKRLVRLQRAYLHMNAGDLAIEHNDFEKATREYAAAEALAPAIVEIPFWQAVTLVGNGKLDLALPIFKKVFEREPIWVELLPRLVDAELMPDDPEAIKAIRAQAVNTDR